MTNSSSAVSQLSDQVILARVHRAVQAERYATANLIALLVELDARRLYLGEGFSSLFTYCTQALHLSEHAAYNRIEAARAARRFPVILALVDAGAVTLTTIRLLSPHLTQANHRELLERAHHKNKREVELLIAALAPAPDAPSVVRKLPTPPAPKPQSKRHNGAKSDAGLSMRVSANSPSTPHPSEGRPIAPERYKIQITVSSETYDRLRRAQNLLRHVVPNGDPAVIFDRALGLLVADLERTKLCMTSRPRAHRKSARASRHIPAAVKREVWVRDGGQCAFQGKQGRCAETGFLEFHHIVPYADGGATTANNLELRCRSHNQHEAEQWFGVVRPPTARESRSLFAG